MGNSIHTSSISNEKQSNSNGTSPRFSSFIHLHKRNSENDQNEQSNHSKKRISIPLRNRKKKKQRILLLGLDGAGKTTIFYRLVEGRLVKTEPTVGFHAEEIVVTPFLLNFWDLGGQNKIRGLWKYYTSNCSMIIFVIDSNDVNRIEEARNELYQFIKNDPNLYYSENKVHRHSSKSKSQNFSKSIQSVSEESNHLKNSNHKETLIGNNTSLNQEKNSIHNKNDEKLKIENTEIKSIEKKNKLNSSSKSIDSSEDEDESDEDSQEDEGTDSSSLNSSEISDTSDTSSDDDDDDDEFVLNKPPQSIYNSSKSFSPFSTSPSLTKNPPSSNILSSSSKSYTHHHISTSHSLTRNPPSPNILSKSSKSHTHHLSSITSTPSSISSTTTTTTTTSTIISTTSNTSDFPTTTKKPRSMTQTQTQNQSDHEKKIGSFRFHFHNSNNNKEEKEIIKDEAGNENEEKQEEKIKKMKKSSISRYDKKKIPILILANKQDLPQALSAHQIANQLGLHQLFGPHHCNICDSSTSSTSSSSTPNSPLSSRSSNGGGRNSSGKSGSNISSNSSSSNGDHQLKRHTHYEGERPWCVQETCAKSGDGLAKALFWVLQELS